MWPPDGGPSLPRHLEIPDVAQTRQRGAAATPRGAMRPLLQAAAAAPTQLSGWVGCVRGPALSSLSYNTIHEILAHDKTSHSTLSLSAVVE